MYYVRYSLCIQTDFAVSDILSMEKFRPSPLAYQASELISRGKLKEALGGLGVVIDSPNSLSEVIWEMLGGGLIYPLCKLLVC